MMTTRQVLINYHYTFASEVIRGLNKFYGLPVDVPNCFEDDLFFNNDILWAIVTISYLFRKDFIKIFHILKNGLKSKKHFKNYCMLIPVKKNNRYFFNYLRRLSLIYEMAVYCYENGYYYFRIARDCMAKFQDKEYFQAAGSWKSLTEVASFLRELGNPLLLVILEESNHRYPVSFSFDVENIEKRLKRQKNYEILNSKEMCFLVEQREKFTARERDLETKCIDSQDEGAKSFTQTPESTSSLSGVTSAKEVSSTSERQAIMDYFRSLIPLYEGSNASKSLNLFESKESCLDIASAVSKECVTLNTKSSSSLNKKNVVDIQFQPNRSSEEHRKGFEIKCGCGDYPSTSNHYPSCSNNTGEHKTGISKPLEGHLKFVEYFSDVKNSKQRSTKNATVEDDSKQQIICSDDKVRHSKLLENDLLLSESSEDESTQQSSTKKERKNASRVRSGPYPSILSSTSECQTTKDTTVSDDENSQLRQRKKDYYDRSTLINLSNFYTSKNVTLQQSTLKKDKLEGNESPVVHNASHSNTGSSITNDCDSSNSSSELTNMLGFKIQSTLSAVASALDVVDSFSGARNEKSSRKSTKPTNRTKRKPSLKKPENSSKKNAKD